MQKQEETTAVRLAAFGEFLLRLHSNSGKRFGQSDGYIPYYAGAEANVCVLLSRLGISTEYITRVPDNDLAVTGLQHLRGHGVGTGRVVYGGDRLGLYFTESGNGIRPGRVIYDRTGSSFATLQPGEIDWASALAGINVFHWSGVAAALSASSAAVCAEALAAAQAAGLTISSDFNYRATLWKYGQHPSAVMPALLQHSDMTVADLDAVNVYYNIETDKQLPPEKRFEQCYDQLRRHMPKLKTLAMSFRKVQGNQLMYFGALAQDDRYYFAEGFTVPQVTDQIGAGDAFTAGILFGVMNQHPPQRTIDFAVACGTLKQSIHGDWALVNEREVTDLMANGPSGRIVR
ncbi:2-dehydro-3-deoxygluconokinase [Chitinophaga eiseniae]|uniref:2-dehydro-3-deoxygluconokinase n=1 Tax=Chitinophaga eiseniae TaxID=634771 RepID=A0A1T4NFM3_9BACT|nr:sugar kinase [Chitinophaga eiseniae]SJZ78059.1 2-dehydro-3-deoxygluconokinase [Chitinophaga eiseniae]